VLGKALWHLSRIAVSTISRFTSSRPTPRKPYVAGTKSTLSLVVVLTYADLALRANDDETQAPRKFRLEGVGEMVEEAAGWLGLLKARA
jgi:hypothetical protein